MKTFLILFSIFLTLAANAEINVKSLEFSTKGNEGRFLVKVDGNINENPILSVKDKFIYLTVPSARVYPRIEKKILSLQRLRKSRGKI